MKVCGEKDVLRIFCIFWFLIYNNLCVGMDIATKCMAGASATLAGAQFIHEVTGDIKERIKVRNAQGDLEPLCPCNKNIECMDDCIESCCTCLSTPCCCNYKKSNCGACFRWIGGVINISTAATAVAL